VGTYPVVSSALEANVVKLDSHSAPPIIRGGVIHVQHTYEVTELSVLPEKRNEIIKAINSTYMTPLEERSSMEQLVRTN
jgi:hypothetical protein